MYVTVNPLTAHSVLGASFCQRSGPPFRSLAPPPILSKKTAATGLRLNLLPTPSAANDKTGHLGTSERTMYVCTYVHVCVHVLVPSFGTRCRREICVQCLQGKCRRPEHRNRNAATHFPFHFARCHCVTRCRSSRNRCSALIVLKCDDITSIIQLRNKMASHFPVRSVLLQ